MKSKHWILLVFAFFGITFIALSTFIIQNDPFQIWLRHDKGFPGNERFMNAGFINTYLNSDLGYDTVIIGTSMTENFSTLQVEKTLGVGKVLKLSTKGSGAVVQNQTIAKALATGKVKNVIWGINSIAYSAENANINQKWTFPEHLYKTGWLANIFGKIEYLISLQTLQYSFDLFQNKKAIGKYWIFSTINSVYSWGNYREAKGDFQKWNSEENIARLKKKHINQVLLKKKYNFYYETNFPTIDQYIIPIIQSNPDVHFNFFFEPFSTLKILTSNTNRFLSLRKYTVEKLARFKNVKIYSFDTAPFVNDLNSYHDPVHHRGSYNTFMVEMMSQNKFLLTQNNIDDYIKLMEEQIRNYDFYSSARTDNL